MGQPKNRLASEVLLVKRNIKTGNSNSSYFISHCEKIHFISTFLKFNKKVIENMITKQGDQIQRNKDVFESEDVVSVFCPQSRLQKPEENVLKELGQKLSNMKMLDVGVGAGRTTIHFAGLTKEYVGIDYSSNMVKACQKKFSNYPKLLSFLTVDARDLTIFEDGFFDFVLFSWCGIDYVNHEDRLKILMEIRRVTRPGGYFCFQTHNLNYQLNNCSIRFSNNFGQSLWSIVWVLQMRLLNKRAVWRQIRSPSKYKPHILFNDGTHEFRLKTYFIAPIEQFEQLKESGFTETRIYGLDGSEIRNLTNTTETWLTYLCKAN